MSDVLRTNYDLSVKIEERLKDQREVEEIIFKLLDHKREAYLDQVVASGLMGKSDSKRRLKSVLSLIHI